MFVKYGGLDDGQDNNFRRIGQDWPVLAFAKSFKVAKKSHRILFALGHVRDPAIAYRPSVLDSVENLSLLYHQKWSSLEEVVSIIAARKGQ